MKYLTSSLLIAVSLLAVGPSYAAKIKKCQDSEGRWHYGDTAAEKCASSQVIELSETGNKTRVIAAPPTEAELADRERQKRAEERKKKLAEEQARQDARLLATYGHENDILYVRDRKLAQIESSISASKETLKSLQATLERLEAQAAHEEKRGDVSAETAENIARNKEQIERHEAVITNKRKEQEELKQQYAEELERYRDLKRRQAAQTAP